MCVFLIFSRSKRRQCVRLSKQGSTSDMFLFFFPPAVSHADLNDSTEVHVQQTLFDRISWSKVDYDRLYDPSSPKPLESASIAQRVFNKAKKVPHAYCSRDFLLNTLPNGILHKKSWTLEWQRALGGDVEGLMALARCKTHA